MSELEPKHDPNQADVEEAPPTPPSTMTSVSMARGVGNSD